MKSDEPQNHVALTVNKQENSIQNNITKNLNLEKKQSVITTEGYIRVIAGAGSGKTRALTHRFAYLVKTLGIPPNKIMSVTFTNKATGGMKKKN